LAEPKACSSRSGNLTTTGFKRRRAEFQDLIYQNLRRVGSNSSDTGTIVPSGAQVGLGVRTAAIYRINEQGNLQQTANTLDMAIQGENMYLQTAASGQPVTGNPATPGFGKVMQGFIETSNVNVVSEITNLITAQRAYEMNSRVITTSDDMLNTLTNLR